MFELTGFQRDLLYVIAGAERPSGQEIKEMISKDVGEVN
ncbi:PadR family transcriptional regulator, partial [Haloferax volcanii]